MEAYPHYNKGCGSSGSRPDGYRLPECEGNVQALTAGIFGACLPYTSFSSMTSLLSVTEKILPLIAVTIKLVDSTNVADELVSNHREAANGLKILSDDLKGLEKQLLQLRAKVGELVNEAKGRGFKKLLRE